LKSTYRLSCGARHHGRKAGRKLKKRLTLFIIGLLLFVPSAPNTTLMVIELFHSKKMNDRYDIVNVSKGYPPSPTNYFFEGNVIELTEEITELYSHTDPWDYRISLADLSLGLNGERLDVLRNHPIRGEEEGLNRYYGEVAFFIVTDHKVDETKFVALLKRTKELQKEKPNGDLVGWVPVEKLQYKLYAIDQGGNVESESFSFNERNPLQTELMNAGVVTPYALGYYTNDWKAYPSYFFPWSFPFLTLIIGLILTIRYFPWRKK
jgi:hypothetical protein